MPDDLAADLAPYRTLSDADASSVATRDNRFTFELLLDVGEVLSRHGYLHRQAPRSWL